MNLRGKSHALRMIPGGRTDDAAPLLLLGHEREFVQRPADLVGPDPLEHLGLQANVEPRRVG
jgi:hypothetical protein